MCIRDRLKSLQQLTEKEETTPKRSVKRTRLFDESDSESEVDLESQSSSCILKTTYTQIPVSYTHLDVYKRQT